MTSNLSGFGDHKCPTMISRVNTDQHSTMDKNEHKPILTFSLTKFMINVYLAKYANFAYFDLELRDLDLDSRSLGFIYILSPSFLCYTKKEQTQYLSIFMSCC